jgi:hypothetical protein
VPAVQFRSEPHLELIDRQEIVLDDSALGWCIHVRLSTHCTDHEPVDLLGHPLLEGLAG